MPVDIIRKGKATTMTGLESIATEIPIRIENHFRVLALHDPEVSIVLTDNDEIAELNAEWRGVTGPTDVLSFPLWEAAEIDANTLALGDIVISVEYAAGLLESLEHRQRVEAPGEGERERWSLDDEIHFLIIHGLLHLVGYDHMHEDEEKEMLEMERKLWSASASS